MDIRTVKVNKNGVWKEINFKELSKGVSFRMFESTGEPVKDKNDNIIFISTSEPYENEDGIWQIDVVD